MSVRKNDRNQRSVDGKLQVIEYAKDLLNYTHDRVKSNVFPKNERWLVAKSLWDNCVGAYSCIVRANSIRVESAEDANERLLLEKRAIGYLDALIGLIDICNINNTISDDRADYWTKLASDTQNLAKAWLKSNRHEFKKYFD